MCFSFEIRHLNSSYKLSKLAREGAHLLATARVHVEHKKFLNAYNMISVHLISIIFRYSESP